MTRLMGRLVLVMALISTATMLRAAPEAQALLDEFSAVDWGPRAQPLVKDLADTAWLTRVRIEHALIGRGPAAVADLIAALDNPNPHVRALAAFCLGAIGDGVSTQPLILRLSEDDNAAVRWHAAEALGRLGDPVAAPALDHAATGGSRWVADMAKLARQRIDDKAPADGALQAMARPAEAFANLAIPAVGAPAPDFDLLTHTGERVRLADFRMKKPVVAIFALANW